MWIGGVILYTLALICTAVSRLIYPYDLGHYEAAIWMPAQLSIEGDNPYSYAFQFPFVMSPYGYFYYLTIGVGLHLFGLQFWFGRGAALLAAAACTGCAYWVARRLTGERALGGFAAVVFITSAPLQSWLALHRSDFPALALGSAAIVIAFRMTDKMKTRWMHGAAICCCLIAAFFFKQTFILPVLISVAILFQAQRYRAALGIAAGTLIGISLTAILLNLTSDGGYFHQHFVLTRYIPYSYYSSLKRLMYLILIPATPVSLCILLAWLGRGIAQNKGSVRQEISLIRKRAQIIELLRSPNLLVVLYLGLAAMLAFVTAARGGSNINYYLETAWIGSIVVAVAWRRGLGALKERWWKPEFAVIVLLVLGGFNLMRNARGEFYRWQSLNYYREVISTIDRYVPRNRANFSVYPELIAFGGRAYLFNDVAQYVDGRSPELVRLFSESLRSGGYGAIILSERLPEDSLPGFRFMPMKHSVPTKFYPVFLYVDQSLVPDF